MEKRSTDQVSIHPLGGILLAVGGFLVALGIMYFDAWSDKKSADFVDSPSGTVWILLIAGQVAFWAVITVPLWSGLQTFRREFRRQLDGSRLQSILFAGVLIALLAVSPRVLPTIEDPLYGHELKIGVISAIGVLAVGVPALVGMFWVRAVAEADARLEPDPHAGEYIYLRDSLQRLLRVVGATIALSTLSTGALQQALVENSPGTQAFPSELVLLWGAGATVLLMLAYVPAYLSLRALGFRLISHLLPMPALGSNDWFDWDAKRKSLGAFLQLDQDLLNRLQAGVFILAPLLSAAITVAIPS